jgi:hypothetical protein
MAARILPQEVTEHLEAAIELSNRRIHLRFLDEADVLLGLDLPAAAVMVAGVVLESLLASAQDRQEDEQRFRIWSELRNRVVAHDATVSLDETREMIEDVRRALMRESRVGRQSSFETKLPERARQIRGKYKFLPTSSDDFIRRKVDELRLERD